MFVLRKGIYSSIAMFFWLKRYCKIGGSVIIEDIKEEETYVSKVLFFAPFLFFALVLICLSDIKAARLDFLGLIPPKFEH